MLAQILGEANSTIVRGASGRIVCDSTKGCTGITLQSVNLVCNHSVPALMGPMQCSGEGSHLRIKDSRISGCMSRQDGGSLRLMDNAVLQIESSLIQHSASQVLLAGALVC